MKANVGGIDRAVRIIAGLAILSLYFVLEGPARWWALLGLVAARHRRYPLVPRLPAVRHQQQQGQVTR